MKSFWIRITSLLLAVGAVLVYDGCVQIRSQKQEIAELTAQVEGYEQWESEVRDTLESVAATDSQTTGNKASADDSQTTGNEASDDTEEGFKDGTYTGSAQGFGGQIEVAVTISKGEISEIDITSASGEDPAYLSNAKSVIDDIIKAQSVEVDTVSGATFSSTGILNAVGEALSDAWQ